MSNANASAAGAWGPGADVPGGGEGIENRHRGPTGPIHPPPSPPQTPGRLRASTIDSSSLHRRHSHPAPLDPYRTLSVRRDATPAELTSAYRSLSLLHHPSRSASSNCSETVVSTTKAAAATATAMAKTSSSEAPFAAISASYQTLINPTYRRRYDASTRSRCRTDEETGRMYYPALSGLSGGTGGTTTLAAAAGGGGLPSGLYGHGDGLGSTSEDMDGAVLSSSPQLLRVAMSGGGTAAASGSVSFEDFHSGRPDNRYQQQRHQLRNSRHAAAAAAARRESDGSGSSLGSGYTGLGSGISLTLTKSSTGQHHYDEDDYVAAAAAAAAATAATATASENAAVDIRAIDDGEGASCWTDCAACGPTSGHLEDMVGEANTERISEDSKGRKRQKQQQQQQHSPGSVSTSGSSEVPTPTGHSNMTAFPACTSSGDANGTNKSMFPWQTPFINTAKIGMVPPPPRDARSPRSFGDESDYDVGAEALDALLLNPSSERHDAMTMMTMMHPSHPKLQQRGLGDKPLPSMDGTHDGGQHYTSDQTDLIFGGPLAPLYRARHFAPFEDPYRLFDRIMGSAVFSPDACGRVRTVKGTLEAERRRDVEPAITDDSAAADDSAFLALAHTSMPPPVSTVAGTAKTTVFTTAASFESASTGISPTAAPLMTNGGTTTTDPTKRKGDALKTVKRTERVVNGSRMIRTETTTVDPQTGKRRTVVEVTKEDIAVEGEEHSEFIRGEHYATQNSRSICDHCAVTHTPGENDAVCSDPFDASELNPLCGQCGREPAVTALKKRTEMQWKENASGSKSMSNSPGESGEPTMEKFSRQISEFFSCCGPASCYD